MVEKNGPGINPYNLPKPLGVQRTWKIFLLGTPTKGVFFPRNMEPLPSKKAREGQTGTRQPQIPEAPLSLGTSYFCGLEESVEESPFFAKPKAVNTG